MRSQYILVAFGFLSVLPFVVATPSRRLHQPFILPKDGGGSELNDSLNGFGEPLNVIISGLSDPRVLTDDGFLRYVQSLGFAQECGGFHSGDPFPANLGDGNGPVNQTVEYREDYGDTSIGTCLESLIGGNHLRMYRQNGTEADTGALFLAVSQEENLLENHTISRNGYDVGRDFFVRNATQGTTHNDGLTYTATTRTIRGLIQPGDAGINHNISTDGKVILLTVKIES